MILLLTMQYKNPISIIISNGTLYIQLWQNCTYAKILGSTKSRHDPRKWNKTPVIRMNVNNPWVALIVWSLDCNNVLSRFKRGYDYGTVIRDVRMNSTEFFSCVMRNMHKGISHKHISNSNGATIGKLLFHLWKGTRELIFTM